MPDSYPTFADLVRRAASARGEAVVLVEETRRLLALLGATRLRTRELLALWHITPPSRAPASSGG